MNRIPVLGLIFSGKSPPNTPPANPPLPQPASSLQASSKLHEIKFCARDIGLRTTNLEIVMSSSILSQKPHMYKGSKHPIDHLN